MLSYQHLFLLTCLIIQKRKHLQEAFYFTLVSSCFASVFSTANISVSVLCAFPLSPSLSLFFFVLRNRDQLGLVNSPITIGKQLKNSNEQLMKLGLVYRHSETFLISCSLISIPCDTNMMTPIIFSCVTELSL